VFGGYLGGVWWYFGGILGGFQWTNKGKLQKKQNNNIILKYFNTQYF
jgi:hypothetical protein